MHAVHLLSFISYLLLVVFTVHLISFISNLLLVVFAVHLISFISYLLMVLFTVPVNLRKCEGLNLKCTSQFTMVLICRFLIFVGAFGLWMVLHSCNVS